MVLSEAMPSGNNPKQAKILMLVGADRSNGKLAYRKRWFGSSSIGTKSTTTNTATITTDGSATAIVRNRLEVAYSYLGLIYNFLQAVASLTMNWYFR